MDKIEEFKADLRQKSTGNCARWHRIDLHNHSPASFDYQGDKSTAIAESAKRIRETDLSIVMFTDHGVLPSIEFTRELSDETGRQILRGVELNVFVDAWEKPEGKVTKNLFFHLLIGFDPDGEESPEYWLQNIYRNCDAEERDTGGHKVKGISSLAKLANAIAGSGAIVIPAHLHSSHDAFRSRSIDDIFADREFLKFARDHCTALEISNDKTAAFFDGTHAETNNMCISCIRSSDSHEPATLGSRTSWVQMENPTFGEMKAALEMPFRFSRSTPAESESYIQGINVKGSYFEDLWIEFSPHCNVMMGVKGSGKTAVLECLRFVLGADIPEARRQQVREHLEFILGPAGTVDVLVIRRDGTRVLVHRSISSTDYEVWFPGDRKDVFTSFDAIDFPTHILGWHEIERAAEDSNIRRIYMDTIAGSSRIKAIEREATRLADKIKEKHAIAASKYSIFSDLNTQTVTLEERRRGLQELDDADLIELHQEYESAVQNAEVVRNLPRILDKTTENWTDRWRLLLADLQEKPFVKQTELAGALDTIESKLTELFEDSDSKSQSLSQTLSGTQKAVADHLGQFETDFAAFKARYDAAVLKLEPEKRKILKSHQSVAEETAGLSALQKERDAAQSEVDSLLIELAEMCRQICTKLDERTQVRTDAILSFGKSLVHSGVSLTVEPLKPGASLQELRGRYREGAQIFDAISNVAGPKRHHESLAENYDELRRDLVNGNSLFFSNPEFAFYIAYFEDDDLHITLEVGKGVVKSIDQLSAGQRCTAIFPLLLKLQSMPLVVDQPEDNLDNRHIASSIAPEVLADKQKRQMIFTSHNANLVVLSDAEMIISFEGDGASGWIENAGFLATRNSPITKDVLEVLDGGRQALELRYKKYGKIES